MGSPSHHLSVSFRGLLIFDRFNNSEPQLLQLALERGSPQCLGTSIALPPGLPCASGAANNLGDAEIQIMLASEPAT